MHNAHYFRTQSDLYFELARRMSLHRDAEYCRVNAERHLARAVQLETEDEASSTPPQAAAPESRYRS